jgi:hypothetical protein
MFRITKKRNNAMKRLIPTALLLASLSPPWARQRSRQGAGELSFCRKSGKPSMVSGCALWNVYSFRGISVQGEEIGWALSVRYKRVQEKHP